MAATAAEEGRMVEAVKDHWLIAVGIVVLIVAAIVWWRTAR